MKLHLPSRLRKALLACLAAVALHSLPATFASGSALIGSGALVSFMLSHQAMAADVEDDADQLTDDSTVSEDADELDILDSAVLEDVDSELFALTSDAVYGDAGISPYAGEYDIAPFASGTWTDPEIFPSEEGSYTSLNSITGDTIDLSTVEGNNLTVTYGGVTKTLNNGQGKNLKIVKVGPNSATTLNGSIKVDNLWLTGNTPNWGTGNNNRFDFGANALTSSIQNIYINKIGVKIANNQESLRANIHIGEGALPWPETDKGYSGLELSSAALQVEKSLTTSGYLEVVEDAGIVIKNKETLFQVSELKGSGNLTISTGANANNTDENKGLYLVNGGSSFQGMLLFAGNNDVVQRLYLGDNLSTAGIGGTRRATIAKRDGGDPVQITITGSGDANSATGITFENVSLKLQAGASQTFTNSSLNSGITMEEGSRLVLTGQSALGGVLTLNGDATLALDYVDGIFQGISSIEAHDHNLALELTILASLRNGTYNLFGELDTSFVRTTLITSGRKTASINESGQLVVSGVAVTWDQAGQSAWTDETGTDSEGAGWKLNEQADRFNNGDDVIFNNADGGTMTLSGPIITSDLTIANGDWVFNATGSSLSVSGTLDTGEHNVTLQGGAFNIASLAGSGTVTYSGTGLTITDASTFTGTLAMGGDLTLAQDLTFGNGGKILFNGNKFVLNAGVTYKGDVDLTAPNNPDGAITLGAGATIIGNITIRNTAYISTGEGEYNLGGEDKTFTLESTVADGQIDFWRPSGSTLKILSTIKGAQKMRLQGGGALRLVHDFNGEVNGYKSITFSDRGNGSRSGRIYFDGLVSNVTSITNSLNKGEGSGDGHIYFMGGVEVSADGLTLNAENASTADKVFHIQSKVTGSSNTTITKTGAGKLVFESGANLSEYLGSLDIQAGTVEILREDNDNTSLSINSIDVVGGATLILDKEASILNTTMSLTGGTGTEAALAKVQFNATVNSGQSSSNWTVSGKSEFYIATTGDNTDEGVDFRANITAAEDNVDLTIRGVDAASKFVNLINGSFNGGSGTITFAGQRKFYISSTTAYDFSDYHLVLDAGSSIGAGGGSAGAITVKSLRGTGGFINHVAHQKFTLTINQNDITQSYTWGGTVGTNGSALYIIKQGEGKQIFSEAWASGHLTVNAGTLELSAGGSAGSLTLGGGTLALGGALEVSTLNVTADSTIELSSFTELQISGLTSVEGTGLVTLMLNAEDIANYIENNLEYELFTDLDLSALGDTLQNLFNVDYNGDKPEFLERVELGNDGKIHFILTTKDLDWAGGDSGVWQGDGEGWLLHGTLDDPRTFAQRDNVFFSTESEDTQSVSIFEEVRAGAMTITKGSWIFNGSEGDSLQVSNLTVESGSELIFNIKGVKSLGNVSLKARAELVVNEASGWTEGETSISGKGALVYNNLVLLEGTTMEALLKGTLRNNPSDNLLAELRLRGNTDLFLNEDGYGNYMRTAHDIYVENGASIGIGSDSMNLSEGVIPTLHLVGGGVGGTKGALYVGDGQNCTVTYGIVIEDSEDGGATVRANINGRIELTGELDAKGNVLTKVGDGSLYLHNITVAGTNGGTFNVQEGYLDVSLANDRDTSLRGYTVTLSEGAELRLDGDYTFRALSGEGSVQGYNSISDTNASTSDADTVARTLKIYNADKEASDKNTYSGTLGDKVKLEVESGFQKLTGDLEATTGLATSGGTLMVSGELQSGKHEIHLSNGGTVDMTGATKAQGGTVHYILTAGNGTLRNVTLTTGDVVSFGNELVTERQLTIKDATLSGGVLDFGWVGVGDEHVTAAPQGGERQVGYISYSGTISYQGTGKLELKVAPAARDEGGEVEFLERGTYLLIENFGDEDDLVHYEDAPIALSRLDYTFEVKDNDLYLVVEKAAGQLSWNVAESGEWNKEDENWLLKGKVPTAFEDGDIVSFGTQKDDTETIVETIVVSISEPVAVGGITVTGATSYVLKGDITSGARDGDKDLGLVVGTLGTNGEAFSGVLTLTGKNSWTGDNTLNSGTIVVEDAQALSKGNVTTVGNAAKLVLNYEEGDLATTLFLRGGVLTNMGDGVDPASYTVRGYFSAGSLNAAGETTLTVHRLAGGTAGHLRVNESGSRGKVDMIIDADSVTSSALSVNGGELTLSSGTAGGTDYSVSGRISVASAAKLEVRKGVTLSGNLQAASAEVTLGAGSALKVTGTDSTVGTLISEGSSMQGSDSGTAVATLTVNADSTLGGVWNISNLKQKKDTVITISGGRTSIIPAEKGEASHISVQDGAALLAGTEDVMVTITKLELGSGEDAAATLASGSQVSTQNLNITNGVLTEGSVLTLANGVGTVSGNGSSLNGNLNVINGAQLSITDGAGMEGTLRIDNGKVDVESDNVAGKANLTVPSAELNFHDCAASTEVTMVSGARLYGTGGFTGTVVVDDTHAGVGAGKFELGGLGEAAHVQLNGLRSVSKVTGLAGTITLVGNSMISLGETQLSREGAMLCFDGTAAAGSYTLADGATLTVDVTDIVNTVTRAGAAGTTYYVFNKGVKGSSWRAEDIIFHAELAAYLLEVEMNAATGSMTFTYNGPMGGVDIFYASEEGDGEAETIVTEYNAMDSYAGVVLDHKTTVDLTGKTMDATHPDGMVLKNLSSTNEGTLNIKGDGSGATLVTIRNTVKDSELEQYAEEHSLEIQNIFTVRGNVAVQDADLQVSHLANDDTELPGSRTQMLGDLSITGGKLLMSGGELELAGGADVEEVSFTRGTSGQLIVSGCTAAVGSISLDEMGAADAPDAHAEHVLIEKDGELLIKSGSMVSSGLTIGNTNEELGGTVSIAGKSIISAGAALQNIVLHLTDNSRLTVTPMAQARALAMDAEEPAATEWVLSGLTSDGTEGELVSDAARDIRINVVGEDSTFSGNLATYNGTMTIGKSEHEQIFDGVLGGEAWSLTNTNGGRMTLDLMGKRARNSVMMHTLSLDTGSHTTLALDIPGAKEGKTGLMLNTLSVASGANVTVAQYNDGMVTLEGEDGKEQQIVLGKVSDLQGSSISRDTVWTLTGVRNYQGGSLSATIDAEGNVCLNLVVDNTNLYAKYVQGENAAAGAKMLWSVTESQGDLAKLDQAVNNLLNVAGAPSAANAAKAGRILAAAAGTGAAALGESLGADLERQLRAIRNRTTALSYGGESHNSVWLNAEGNYHKQNADDLMPGYKLNGWGGTVGAHTEVSSMHSTLGVALTAMYNDVETDGADRLKGDLDTTYLSAFAQVAHRAWRHTIVATVGTASVDATRTVNYGEGAYTASMSTDGLAFGLMYEVGYSLPLRRDDSVCLQPVLNVAWKLTSIDAYTETGSSAALHVGEQSYNTITFGAGLRMQAAAGSRLWNRTGLLEARALVKADVGDRQGEADTFFASAPGSAIGRVKSAERGAVGVELGAGLSVPTGTFGSVFADFSAELRADYTNLNATIGYKISF